MDAVYCRGDSVFTWIQDILLQSECEKTVEDRKKRKVHNSLAGIERFGMAFTSHFDDKKTT